MLGSPAGPGGSTQRSLWPLAPAPAPTATGFTADGFSKCGVYSLFPGGPNFSSALYSHARTIGQFTSGQFQQSGNPFHHKVSDSLFSSTGYTFGAPTPPPGSPYSPVPVTQLELLTKGFNSNIIIQQPDYPISPKKLPEIVSKQQRCDEKCCSGLRPQKSCNCQLGSPVKSKFAENGSGCSRTNPIEWGSVNVKKEPGATPCQVAEVSTSASPVIKLEITSPKTSGEHSMGQDNVGGGSNVNHANNNIPVGIAVARQRFHQQEVVGSPSLPPAGLLTTVNAAAVKEVARISEIAESASTAGMAASTTGGGIMGGATGGTLLQCTDERTASLAGWSMGGAHSSTLGTPTLWQYPAPVPMEPMVPLPVPMPPVGFQLVRDPTTGGLLLLPTTGLEPLQQAVVWPSYHQPPSVLLPPLPPPPLQLLSSTSSDYLSSSTTLHQHHTQTHSTRLVAVTTDNKRKIPLPIPATTLIKIETDATTLDQTKTLQAVSHIASNTGTVFTDQSMAPLVTTHVIYQHPTNLILSQPSTAETMCRSQATSPVACLTPPPETSSIPEEHSLEPLAVQDASNQTDTPICSEDDNTVQTVGDIVGDFGKTKPQQEDGELKFETHELDDSASINNTPVPELVQDVPKPIEPEQVQEVSSHADEVLEDTSTDQQKPDISGLELLSNSIVEFESCRSNVKIESNKDDVISQTEECDIEPMTTSQPISDNSSLGGLDLLCALAEQRIMEEKVEKQHRTEKEHTRERKKRKSKRHSDEPKRKKSRNDKNHSGEERRSSRKHRRDSSESKTKRNDYEKPRNCRCREENYRSYKTPESEEEVKRFIASKTQSMCCKSDWPCMNEMELDMRIKLADLQRQYREKQMELSKLKPKKHSQVQPKKASRKKSTYSEHGETPPPLLDKVEVVAPTIIINNQELLKPPTLCAVEPIKAPKLEAIKQSDRIINDYNRDLLRQRAMEELESSPEKNSSSKKRKVGRPKKLSSPSGFHVATETIVAKKPKNSFVGYLLAAKEKYQLQSKPYSESPPRYVEETTTITHRTKKNKNNNNIIIEEVKSCKIRPKLKAEPTIKSYQEEDDQWETQDDDDGQDVTEEEQKVAEEEQEQPENKAVDVVENDVDEGVQFDEDEEILNEETKEVEEPKITDTRCILTGEHLEVDKMRVLTAMGGLFYAGHLNAVEPPDVYSITLDGERGNKPHIMSREEILRDAIVEVSPKSTEELAAGTRLCAYWSQQYRCLYPGSVAEPGTPDPALDSKFVAVEFDDGDSGRIALEDIRLLPPDYPIVEYDPNPLQSLSKRRRRTSNSVSTEERKQSAPPQSQAPPLEAPKVAVDRDLEKENKDINKPDSDPHKERKKLKKKKKDKLKEKLLYDDKKKKKKYKCMEESCKRKKHHKKHKKHKKHHRIVSEEKAEKEGDDGEPTLQTVTEEEECDDAESYDQFEDQEMTSETSDFSPVGNPEDEVTMDDISEAAKTKKSKKIRDRQESCESRSKMSAFLPARQLWSWRGKSYKRPRGKGRSRKLFYKEIQRGKEIIQVGDSAVFLSTGRPDRPYIGQIEGMWELCGTMAVKVKWFYHPEETQDKPEMRYPGALFESPHIDENDVQTIAHKCEVLSLGDYTTRLGDDPERYAKIYDNNDLYYLAGYYDPTAQVITMKPDIPVLTD